jgi:hypothetical protein
MGRAYTDEPPPDRHAVLMIMQGCAAPRPDPEIRRHVREKSGDMVLEVAELAGAHPNEVWAFLATEIPPDPACPKRLAAFPLARYRRVTARA